MKKLFWSVVAVFLLCDTNAQSLYFPPLAGNLWDTLSPQSLNYCTTKIDSLYTFLDENDTKAFILLKDGKIVLEKYFGTHTQSSLWQWASAGKTITSFMVGVAQQEGHLSISDTTSTYLGQAWTDCTLAQEEKITLFHQLTMTSGLDDGVPDNHCTEDSCLIYKSEPGSRWAYHNAPYTLLDPVIESATGMTLNQYTTQKLKTPTGITGAFVSVGYNNVYFSNARSMARFGILVQNRGTWNGNPIMTDTAYFNQMVNTSQQLNKSYGYLWWLNGKSSFMIPGPQNTFSGSLCPNAPSDMIAAMGKDGQFLNVVPSQGLVWIRMGGSPNALPVPYLLNDAIWQHLNDLYCHTTGINNLSSVNKNSVRMYPNPSNGLLHISSESPILSIKIYNTQGQLVYFANPQQKDVSLSIETLPQGVYFVNATLTDGSFWTNSVIKE